MLDSGFSSAATFLVGIYAVRHFDPSSLGAYALCFQAIFLASVVSANLVLVPAQVAMVATSTGVRQGHLGGSLKIGAIPALCAACLVMLWIVAAPADVPRAVIIPLTVTGIAVAALSPLQDHARVVLHIEGTSWRAAAVAGVQLGSVASFLAIQAWLHVPPSWIPFGSLGLANLVSLGVAARLGSRSCESEGESRLCFGRLWRYGTWLVASASLPQIGLFAAAILVSRLAGASHLGYAEAARIAASPLWVFALGLMTILRPGSLQAGARRDAGQARRNSRFYLALLIPAAVAYAAVFGYSWPGNPLRWFLGSAYAIPGLVLVTIVAELARASVMPFNFEMLGAKKQRSLIRVEIAAAGVQVIVAAAAPLLRAFAMPLSQFSSNTTRLVGFRGELARHVYVDLRDSAPKGVAGQ